MKWKNLQKPKKLEKEELRDNFGRFISEPFERGYAVAIGNAIRRILLSSIPGAAVTAVKIEGVQHEFATIKGVMEDVSEIILNIKQLKLVLEGDGPKKIYLEASGEREVTGADIKADSDIKFLNPQLHIATLTSREAKLMIEMEVDSGRGYVTAEKNKRDDMPLGTIPIDSVFTPVTNVKLEVENTRVGQITDYDKLILEIGTDSRVAPETALTQAALILREYLNIFITQEGEIEIKEDKMDEENEKQRTLLGKTVDELELSVRSANCLKNANIKSIIDLVTKSEVDMLKYRNFGRKSLNEIKEVLVEMGLGLGMKIDKEVLKEIKKGKK
ncbi:MAG: DNA-directed RNA polymerase subunit alpha [Candidatus Goldiibacteriota bacterium HGW-Goldbacteria-1]|jgi:DNA-directed RNA polymerase subunit alpha|nr:MAG: DNA-directed RNA polymerase subunit alpha [Candidatus Goldiibacteriota bacterium HGW-Goldbacteria-1]